MRFVTALYAGVMSIAIASPARAEPVAADGKGIAGGALLGAEIVVMGEAALGIDAPWLYLVGVGVGGGGGALGGYYVERNANPSLCLAMLVAGTALVIPTALVYASAVAYEPPPEVEPGTEEWTGETSFSRDALTLRRSARGPSLLRLDADSLQFAVPNVALEDMYTRREVADFGVSQRTRVMLPLFDASF